MKEYRTIGSFLFRPGDHWFYIFLIVLAIFILGVQVGIKHGRELEREDIFAIGQHYECNY